MKKQDYTKHSEKGLNELLKDLRIRIMVSHGFIGKDKEKPTNRKRLRQEIARIETELSRRTNGWRNNN